MDIIKEDVFRKQLKTGLSGGYLFFGEEDYLKSFSLRSAREAILSDETFAVFNDVSIAPIDYTPAAGDSFNDLAMITASQSGFLFRAPDHIIADHPQIPAFTEYNDLLDAIRKVVNG